MNAPTEFMVKKILALDELTGVRVGEFTLVVQDFAPARFANQREFVLQLRRDQTLGEAPIFRGTFSAPVAALNLAGWIDGEFIEQTRVNKTMVELWNNACDNGLALEVLRALGATIPPGGRMWLAYERYGEEGASIIETREGSRARVPPLATPLGFLLWAADCWLGVRDWHFPEGGREGPRKLQGNKALHREHARQRAREARDELNAFLKQPTQNELERRAQRRARKILGALKKIR